MIELDLKTFLTAAVTGGRVHALILPLGAPLPAVTYQLISAPSELDSAGVVDLIAARFQVRTIGTTYGAAKSAAQQITTALNGYSGTMGGSTIGAAWRDNYSEDHETETGFYTVTQDYNIHFKE